MVFRKGSKCIICANFAADHISMNAPRHDPCSTPYVKVLVMAYVSLKCCQWLCASFYLIACCSVTNKISEKQPLDVCLLIQSGDLQIDFFK